MSDPDVAEADSARVRWTERRSASRQSHRRRRTAGHARRGPLARGASRNAYNTSQRRSHCWSRRENPHTVISLAYFDLDIYEPTRDASTSRTHRLSPGAGAGRACSGILPPLWT